jgi:CelD/BcsL family acetyltransferase involved in cellulose biosynthesis
VTLREDPGGAVLQVDPRTDPLWSTLAARPGGSLFTSPPWIGAVSDTYGFEPTARVTVDTSGRPVAGVVWADVRDLRGQRRLALPFSDRADPIVDGVDRWNDVAADVFAGDLPFTLRCLDNSPATGDPRFESVGEAAWHATPLNRPLDELHAAFRRETRRNIGIAARAGVKVVLSSEIDAAREFHRLHVLLRKRKYRMLAQPFELLERIWSAFAPSDGLRTGLALLDGRVVAGAVYLVWRDTVYLKFSASEKEFLRQYPNEALHWELIQWAHDRGLRTLDWGLSDLDQPGLISFKAKWASTEGRIRTLNAGGPPTGRSADVEQTLRTLTELLTDPSVPDAVTERGGAALYRYFC